LSRRRFLRGLGVCMALPAFESLAPSSTFAAPAAASSVAGKTAPVRMAFVYVPNGTIPSAWWPEGDGGKDFALSRTLQPLEKVRHELQVISGLEDRSADQDRTAAAITPGRAALFSPVFASKKRPARTFTRAPQLTRWWPGKSAI
jgi:hypothetical protein